MPSIHFVFDFAISWEPQDFERGEKMPETDEEWIQASRDNLLDCMHDWVSDGSPLDDNLTAYVEEDPKFWMDFDGDHEAAQLHTLKLAAEALQAKLKELDPDA